jgi:retinol dehydrogenase-12
MRWDDLNLEKSYPGYFLAYCHSKLANCLFTLELAERYGKDGITAVSVHPGMVKTNIARDLGRKLKSVFTILVLPLFPFYLLAAKTTWQGAQTTIHCAVDEHVLDHNGKYFV